MRQHGAFRVVWRSVNLFLLTSASAFLISAGWEYSVRRYLQGFSDAIVPAAALPEQRVEAILGWMRSGPSRASTSNSDGLGRREPEDTLNYQELLQVCGTATNAFLNVAKSAGLDARRLLLLDSKGRAKHVVAEVLIDDRWVVVDPAYRAILRDARGQLLTRRELRSPEVLFEATRAIPDYPPEYDFASVAHMRMARILWIGEGLRKVLDGIDPGWDEAAGWSLILERRSLAMLLTWIAATLLLLVLRTALAWYADHKLHIPRLGLRAQLRRAGAALFSSPELK